MGGTEEPPLPKQAQLRGALPREGSAAAPRECGAVRAGHGEGGGHGAQTDFLPQCLICSCRGVFYFICSRPRFVPRSFVFSVFAASYPPPVPPPFRSLFGLEFNSLRTHSFCLARRKRFRGRAGGEPELLRWWWWLGESGSSAGSLYAATSLRPFVSSGRTVRGGGGGKGAEGLC